MRLHIASPTSDVLSIFWKNWPDRILSVLLTIARMPSDLGFFLHQCRHLIYSLALDSGAFSLGSASLNMTPEQLFLRLCAVAGLNLKNFDLIFNFDEGFGLNSLDANMANLVVMESRGISAIPVIHNLYNHEADFFINRGHKRIAIGQCRGRTKYANLKKPVMKLHENGVLIHFFGGTSYSLLSRLPIWSCDSSSWTMHAKHGVVLFWNPEKAAPGVDATDRLYFPEYQGQAEENGHFFKDYEHRTLFEAHLDKFGLGLSDLLGNADHLYQRVVNIIYYCQLQDAITAEHARRGWVFED